MYFIAYFVFSVTFKFCYMGDNTFKKHHVIGMSEYLYYFCFIFYFILILVRRNPQGFIPLFSFHSCTENTSRFVLLHNLNIIQWFVLDKGVFQWVTLKGFLIAIV